MYCADCCINCIFLDIEKTSENRKKYRCLIYNNKYRRPIMSATLIEIESFLEFIERIILEEIQTS